jgi:hypothetical protein
MFSAQIYRLIFLPPVTFLDSFFFLEVAVGRYDQFVRFEVLTAFFLMNIYIWDVAPIRQVEIFGRSKRTYCFHF